MDRRQRKTREAIFAAFSALVCKKDFNQITVGEIIERADVGRATFYAHFETKDDLLKEFCNELFCHIADVKNQATRGHRHIFDCDAAQTESVFLHLFEHIQKNDNNIIALLSSQNNELFLRYFKQELACLIDSQQSFLSSGKQSDLPQSFWKAHIVSCFIETVKWWIDHGMNESPETITSYFLRIV